MVLQRHILFDAVASPVDGIRNQYRNATANIKRTLERRSGLQYGALSQQLHHTKVGATLHGWLMSGAFMSGEIQDGGYKEMTKG